MVNYNRNSNYSTNNNKHHQQKNRTLHANNKENILDHGVNNKEENNNSIKKVFNNSNTLNGFNNIDTVVNGNGMMNGNHGSQFDDYVKSSPEEPIDEGTTVLSACSRSPVVATILECPDEPVSSRNISSDRYANTTSTLNSALNDLSEPVEQVDLPRIYPSLEEEVLVDAEELQPQNESVDVLSQRYDVRDHYAFFNRLFFDNAIMGKWKVYATSHVLPARLLDAYLHASAAAAQRVQPLYRDYAYRPVERVVESVQRVAERTLVGQLAVFSGVCCFVGGRVALDLSVVAARRVIAIFLSGRRSAVNCVTDETPSGVEKNGNVSRAE